MTETVDAVVIGAGPNGLVATIALADAGWDVLLLETNPEVGGAVRSAEVTAPGFTNDLFSAFYPLAAASPIIKDLDLEGHGLSWVRAPAALAHHLDDGRAALLSHSLDETVENLEEFAPGDGEAWATMFEEWQTVRDPIIDALFTPFPPVRAALAALRRLGTAQALELARLAVLPVRRFGDERFHGDGGPLLLTGNAQHADVPPDAAGSGIFGWLLCMLGQDVGFPVPEGGAQKLADAMALRAKAAGASIQTSARVDRVLVEQGRAVGVRTADGREVRARKAVLADVAAPVLFRDLVGLEHLPAKVEQQLDRFHWDSSTLKLNWALREPVPWLAKPARRAGTVHLGPDLTGFVDLAADLSVGRMPRTPFILFGQMTTADPTRSPEGTESAWAYTHLPRSFAVSDSAVLQLMDRVTELLEQHAPGFSESVLTLHVQTPADLEAADANLVGGAINAGTAAIHQQLVFRPLPGLGRPETPLPGLYLAGASAHPGGGVHGACGWNAARAALGRGGAVRRRLLRTAWGRLL
ncbi:MAG TPA: NAD(P)/FAD-dependent oxidoreductase [Nocardioidaceae bacterium]|nr:NAD(P)/FAD-dependent oxidoreductase [Nocardioidaceae bacterium]